MFKIYLGPVTDGSDSPEIYYPGKKVVLKSSEDDCRESKEVIKLNGEVAVLLKAGEQGFTPSVWAVGSPSEVLLFLREEPEKGGMRKDTEMWYKTLGGWVNGWIHPKT